jgi:hypothetical protein
MVTDCSLVMWSIRAFAKECIVLQALKPPIALRRITTMLPGSQAGALNANTWMPMTPSKPLFFRSWRAVGTIDRRCLPPCYVGQLLCLGLAKSANGSVRSSAVLTLRLRTRPVFPEHWLLLARRSVPPSLVPNIRV